MIEGGEESMGEEEVLHGPPTLTWDIGHPCCMLTAVSAGLTVVLSRLKGVHDSVAPCEYCIIN